MSWAAITLGGSRVGYVFETPTLDQPFSTQNTQKTLRDPYLKEKISTTRNRGLSSFAGLPQGWFQQKSFLKILY